MLIPEREPFTLAISRILFKLSATKIYNKGESRNPCLIPLEALKKGLSMPFIRGDIQGDLIHYFIHENCLPKPSFSRMRKRKE